MISDPTILRVAIPSPLRKTFDYLLPEDCEVNSLKNKIGARVLVNFGKRELVGIIWEITNQSNLEISKLKPILKILDDEPLLTPKILELLSWASEYYHHPIGEVLIQGLPNLLRKHKINKKKVTNPKTGKKISFLNQSVTKNTFFALSKHQEIAIRAVANNFKPYLLHGVTGSGKTEVYLNLIAKIINANKQALILVPEINLTPQTVQRFQERFPDKNIAVIHSRCTHTKRMEAWLAARDGTAEIIIGTRSAIFTPLKNPGIIILDEEHDASFKQQSGLRYSARDIALMRGKMEDVPVMLGSATPSLETFYNAYKKRYQTLLLPERVGNATFPKLNIIDLRKQKIIDGFSKPLIQAIDQHLNQNGQILIFLNRRGFAPVVICHDCGFTVDCKHCDAHMTFHRETQKLHCHHCNAILNMPKSCPKCGKTQLLTLGLGTERIENAIKKLFPGISAIRIDQDSTRKKNALQNILHKIQTGENQIMIGTQMLAKGHHFPNVTMVAILNADDGLFSTDFRASERLAQLILQVAGRAGRAEKSGEVFIQTHNPTHPFLQRLITEGYESFAMADLHERKAAELPPFSHFALIRGEAKNKEKLLEFLKNIGESGKDFLTKNNLSNTKILGPILSPMERKAGNFRAQLLLQSNNRKNLHQLLNILIKHIETTKISHSLKWHLDVDPIEIF